MRRTNRFLPLALLFIVGCDSEAGPVHIEPTPAPAKSTFDPANCGTITGRVTWDGPKPFAPSFIYGVPKPDGSFDVRLIPNPNVPAIDDTSHAIAGAVVFLRKIDPAATKPWDHPPVRVEMQDRGIQVVQGDSRRRVGFVRRGDAVAMLSMEPAYHVLRARGSAYFSLAFPEPDQPLTRTFDKLGRVELSSGAGYYWASADLLVVDHPYYTVADRDGRFAFSQVPVGPVEVVAWLPGWDAVKQERDPETGLIFRQTYAPPLEIVRSISLELKRSAEVSFVFPTSSKP